MQYLLSFFLISFNCISCEPDFVNINSADIDYFVPIVKFNATTTLTGLFHKRAKQEEALNKLTDLSETGNSEIDNNDIDKQTIQNTIKKIKKLGYKYLIDKAKTTTRQVRYEPSSTVKKLAHNYFINKDNTTTRQVRYEPSSTVTKLAHNYFINKDKTTTQQVRYNPSIQYFNMLRDDSTMEKVTEKHDSFEKQLQNEKEKIENLKQKFFSGTNMFSTSAYTESYNNTDSTGEYYETESIEESSEKESDRKEMLYDKIFLFGDINNKSNNLDHSDTSNSKEHSDNADNLIERIKRNDTKMSTNKAVLRSIETHDSTEFELENSVTKIRDISKESFTFLETSKTPTIKISSVTMLNNNEYNPIKIKLTTPNVFNNPYLNAKLDRADPMIMKSIYKFRNVNYQVNNINPEWKKLHYDSSYSDDNVDLLKENIDKACKAVVKRKGLFHGSHGYFQV